MSVHRSRAIKLVSLKTESSNVMLAARHWPLMVLITICSLFGFGNGVYLLWYAHSNGIVMALLMGNCYITVFHLTVTQPLDVLCAYGWLKMDLFMHAWRALLFLFNITESLTKITPFIMSQAFASLTMWNVALLLLFYRRVAITMSSKWKMSHSHIFIQWHAMAHILIDHCCVPSVSCGPCMSEWQTFELTLLNENDELCAVADMLCTLEIQLNRWMSLSQGDCYAFNRPPNWSAQYPVRASVSITSSRECAQFT